MVLAFPPCTKGASTSFTKRGIECGIRWLRRRSCMLRSPPPVPIIRVLRALKRMYLLRARGPIRQRKTGLVSALAAYAGSCESRGRVSHHSLSTETRDSRTGTPLDDRADVQGPTVRHSVDRSSPRLLQMESRRDLREMSAYRARGRQRGRGQPLSMRHAARHRSAEAEEGSPILETTLIADEV
jgi:hypothetical protein